MLNLLNERRLTLTALAQLEDVDTSTTWRWALKGARGVLLETFCVGGRRYTSEEAFSRFVDKTTAAAKHKSTISSANCQREEEISRTETELDGLDIRTKVFPSEEKSDPLDAAHSVKASSDTYDNPVPRPPRRVEI